jgi:hypothetical protein
MASELKIGITISGVQHHSFDAVPDLETKFRMVRESGAYDYVDRTPPDEEVSEFQRLSEKYGLPVRAGGWFYLWGRDNDLLKRNLDKAQALGSIVHNVQIMATKADGKLITDDEVADAYCDAYEYGRARGVDPCFEVHVNMWSENLSRVGRVGELVRRRGFPFYMTLDHSHVIFKIDNPVEQDIAGIRHDVEAGRLVLDPFAPGNVTQRWVDAGYVRHAHARAAVPNGPKNVWSRDNADNPGRGIQYPFIRPAAGEWHSDWDETRLEPWKEVVRQVLRHHAADAGATLQQISTEFILGHDYGAHAKYSNFEHSVACARWIRETWDAIRTAPR